MHLAACVVGIIFPRSLPALVIEGYTPARHDRFASGYPTNPVPNSDPSFIGAGYDWSGVGWDTNYSSRSIALLGPKFFLEANHWKTGSTVSFFSSDSQLKSYSVQTHSGSLGSNATSDLCLGVLSSPIPASDQVAYYPVLFMGYSIMPYINRDLLVYGWTAKIGKGIISGVEQFTGDTGYYFKEPVAPVPDRAAFQSGDSSSPSFIVTNNPGEIYLAGAHYAVDHLPNPTLDYDSALPLMLDYVENYMAQYGYLPYVVTPVTAVWLSGSGSQWGTGSNWSTGAVPVDTLSAGKVIDCASVLFDGDATTQYTVNLGATRTVTGVTFESFSGAHAFTFSTGNTLQVGEAGIVNNDLVQQTFNCTMLLRSSQCWDAGFGGIRATGSINTGTASPGNLLVVDGSGSSLFSGAVTGTGGLSKDGSGTLTLSGTNSYSGKTFILDGSLQIGNGGSTGTLGSNEVVNDAVLIFNRNNDFFVGNLISGTGSLVKLGGGNLTLTNTNTYTGSTIVSAGMLTVDNLIHSDQVTVEANAQLFARSIVTNALTIGGSGAATGAQIAAVPEPSALVLLTSVIVLGLGGFWIRRRRGFR